MEPLTIIGIIGLALSAAGSAAGMTAQYKAQSAQNAQRAAELYRQSQYTKKAGAVVDQQIQESSATAQKPAIDAATDDRAAAYNRITAPFQQTKTITRTTGQPAAPFAAAAANQAAVSNAWNKIVGGAQARLGAYQDWGLARNIAQQHASQELGTISRNAIRSAGVSDAEQSDASHEGDALAAGGDLLSTAGRDMLAYRTSQAGKPTYVDPNDTAAWGQVDWSIPG